MRKREDDMDIRDSFQKICISGIDPLQLFRISAGSTVPVSAGVRMHCDRATFGTHGKCVPKFSGTAGHYCADCPLFMERNFMALSIIPEMFTENIPDGITGGCSILDDQFSISGIIHIYRKNTMSLFCRRILKP